MSSPDDRIIAIAALLGGNPVYFDYGHPERASARMYWTIGCWTPENPCSGPTIYGYTRADCARRWLKTQHPDIKLPPR